MKLKPAQIRAIVRFAAAGAVALAIHKAEGIINKKTEELFPDEPKPAEETN